MGKFNVVATITTTRTLVKMTEAKNLEEATAKVLLNSKTDDWKTTKKLSTNSK